MTTSNQAPLDIAAWLNRTDPTPSRDPAAWLRERIGGATADERAAALTWLGLDAAPAPDAIRQSILDHLPNDARGQAAVIAWLTDARNILAGSRLSTRDKLTRLAALPAERSALDTLTLAGQAALAGYRRLPLALQVALPATAVAAPFLGGAGVGIAALGGAVGLPALLVFFLGVAGVSALLESLLKTDDQEAVFARGILALLATDAALFRLNQATRAAVATDIAAPRRCDVPQESAALLERLRTLDPIAFERHVLSLFADLGMTAWATPASGDAGIDGVVKDGSRLILVQCKRYAADNPVGRPAIQQFKGVIEENAAELGVFVTTSDFTAQARESAAKNRRLHLVNADELTRWHGEGGPRLPDEHIAQD